MLQLVSWPKLSHEHKAAVRALQVSERQIEYAGSIEASVSQCEAEPSPSLAGLGVLVHSVVVGFLLLKRAASAPQWAPQGAAVVSALRIGEQSQGQGLGTQALLALPAWVKANWPDVERIDLSVDEENEVAIRSYSKAGWVDQGVRVQGRIGWVRYMSRSLLAAPYFER